MTWNETLVELREELAEVRAERKQQTEAEEAELQEVRGEMSRLADSLEIIGLLSEMNAALLDDQGTVEAIVSWESGDDAADDEDEDDDGDGLEGQNGEDVITTVLAWEEDGEREIAVEVVATEEGISLQVNGVIIRGDRVALEQGLIEAFRDELEV